jgi:hypothetical protein
MRPIADPAGSDDLRLFQLSPRLQNVSLTFDIFICIEDRVQQEVGADPSSARSVGSTAAQFS